MRPGEPGAVRRGGYLLWSVGVALAAAMAAAPWLGRVSAKADLAAQFLLQAAVGTAALVVLALLGRRLVTAAFLAVTLGAQAAWLAPHLGPSGTAAVAAAAPLRVAFFNVWRGNRSLPDVVAWLERERPDVVVIAEYSAEMRRALMPLDALYPLRFDCLTRPGCDLAVLSRRGGVPDLALPAAAAADLIELAVPLGDTQLRVLGAHLTRPVGVGTVWNQLTQVKAVAGAVRDDPRPTILLGDLNAVPWGRVVHELGERSGLRVVGSLDGTWPAFLPWPLRIPIDHALVSPGVVVTEHRLGPDLGSDHRPILLDLVVEPARTG
jgi:endonuclease/exonuclease/phosphatase (EEP) superfamily protein YafD